MKPRPIRVELAPEAYRRYPNAVVRARRIYFPHGTYRPKPEIPTGQKIALLGGAGAITPEVI